MSQAGAVYGQSLYALAKDEGLEEQLLRELSVLEAAFDETPAFLKLLTSHNIALQERLGILEESFRDKVHPYLLNFLKILTEKGYAPHFHACYQAYSELYDEDNGILAVTAKTAVPLTPAQSEKLTNKLSGITGKTIRLTNKVDSAVLGGVQLDMGNRRVEDTVAGRLEAISKLLRKTTL